MTVSVSSGVATYAINTSVDLAGQIRVAGVKVDVEATVSIGLAAPGPAGGSTVTLSLPPNDETPVETGTDPHTLQLAETTVDSITATESLTGLSLGLSGLLGIENAILDVMLTDANGFLNKALAPLAANVDTMLVGPLVDLLGLRIGGADMFALSASCNTPALRG